MPSIDFKEVRPLADFGLKIHGRIKRMSALCCILLISCPFPVFSETGADNVAPSDTSSQSQELNELVVEGVKGLRKDRIGGRSISGAEINRMPVLFGEHDVIKALQTTSGVVAGNEGFAGFYVRGGETDQNLYLVDGLPLLNVYHFGGLFSTFITHSVDGVDFYKGAFPASFSERASSIVDVALRKPDYYRTSGTFSIGLISGQLYFTTPLKKGRAALAVALRRTWLDALTVPALAIMNSSNKTEGLKRIFRYNFTDVSVKFSATDRHRNEMSLLLFYGQDRFKLGEERFDPKTPTLIRHKELDKMSWGNWGMAFTCRMPLPRGELLIEPFVSKAFSSDLYQNINDVRSDENMITSTEVRPSVLQAGMRETYRFPIATWLEGEAGMNQAWHDYDVSNPLVRYRNDDASGEIPARQHVHSRDWLLSGYGEVRWHLWDALHGSAGIRAARYIGENMKHFGVEPRVSLKVSLPYSSSVSLAYSRTHQYAQQVSSNYIYLPSDAWLPTADCAKPLKSDIYSIGYFKNIRADYNVKAELWWKNMWNLAYFKPGTSAAATALPWNEKLTFGKGWAYGLDLEADGRFGNVGWNVAYGLMWNWRKFPELNSGKRFPAKFDNRHKFDVGVNWKINSRMELTGQWEYVTGNRTTLALYNVATPDLAFPDAPFMNPIDPAGTLQNGMDYYDSRNNVRMPSFHRLNLGLSYKGRLKGRMTYQWDFGLYNAYCRMNPFAIIKSYVNEKWSNQGDYRKFKTISLVPVLPSVSFTLNF